MASVQVTETSVDIELSALRTNGVYRVEVATRSRTDVAAIAYGRSQTDVLFSPGTDVLPADIKAALLTVMNWLDAQAKTRWDIP